jgi:hypothetical protein
MGGVSDLEVKAARKALAEAEAQAKKRDEEWLANLNEAFHCTSTFNWYAPGYEEGCCLAFINFLKEMRCCPFCGAGILLNSSYRRGNRWNR